MSTTSTLLMDWACVRRESLRSNPMTCEESNPYLFDPATRAKGDKNELMHEKSTMDWETLE
jgi:hypothetical protein